jgi:hypothetical protein
VECTVALGIPCGGLLTRQAGQSRRLAKSVRGVLRDLRFARTLGHVIAYVRRGHGHGRAAPVTTGQDQLDGDAGICSMSLRCIGSRPTRNQEREGTEMSAVCFDRRRGSGAIGGRRYRTMTETSPLVSYAADLRRGDVESMLTSTTERQSGGRGR